MNLLGRLGQINWRLVLAALFAVGILHILATLAAPELTSSAGYARLTRDLPLNRMQVLPPVTAASQPLPFMSPDARYAVCRFDTEDGAVLLNASLPAPGWVLALYSPDGGNFYTSVAQPGRKTDVSLMLVGSDERLNGLNPQATGGLGLSENTLTVAARSGVAVLRAPDQGLAYSGRTIAALQEANCTFRKL